jgi:hypothetical protein
MGLAPGIETPPDPSITLPEAGYSSGPAGYSSGPVTEESARDVMGGHTRLMYTAVLVTHPNISEETSGFMDWNQGFGSAIYNDLQFFDSTSEYRFNVNDAAASSFRDIESTNIGGYKSNFVALTEYWNDAHLYGSIPIATYCKVSHQGNGIAFADFDGDGAVDAVTGDLNIDARNTQVLIDSHVEPLGDGALYWRVSPTGDWARPRLYNTYYYQRYNKYWPKLYRYDTRLDNGASISGEDKLFIASVENFKGSYYGYGGDDSIYTDMKNRFPHRDTLDEMSDEYMNARRNYLSNLIGKTLQVPKEYRARRQITPTIDASRLSSIADTNQYVMDVAASVPGMTSPTSTSTTPGTSYSAGTSTGGGGSY